ncbi:MAG: phosphoribosylamine--glycine ligase [Candidatus Aminicenantes bacterium]|nr:phosphoribosylamine--glycine ligase [Candidatus Aminicenantes bacterium]
MRVLIVGSGGREHALAWKIRQSPLVKEIFCAPGNGGTAIIAENVPIKETDIQALADFAVSRKIDLTIVGPETPLVAGITDVFEEKGLKIFGPSRKAAEIEGSKIFAKQFMVRHRIPTARFQIADTPEIAMKIIRSGEFLFPMVIKADGLAGGKGAIICNNLKKAEETVHNLMVKKQFGPAGERIIIEEYLRGHEASFIVISDGTKALPLVTTKDHKPVFDGDRGPNTGGMGAISPSPHINKEEFVKIMETIILPTITRLLEERRKFVGVLYAGLMMTDEGPKVLEFNCRFGDPETQPQMLRLESDLVEIILNALEGNVLMREVNWSTKPAACVVVTSGGYPLKYETGKKISGLDKAESIPGVIIFHAGTKIEDGNFVTSGGRVLGVCASEKNLEKTMEKIYGAISVINFEGMHFRRDIGCEK